MADDVVESGWSQILEVDENQKGQWQTAKWNQLSLVRALVEGKAVWVQGMLCVTCTQTA